MYKYLTFEEMHALEALHMDDFAHPFVFQTHWRGKGAHLDHRWMRRKGGQILDGMTAATMKPGIAKESVETVAEALKYDYSTHPELWKISNEPGPLRMFAESKAPEPIEWLYYKGVVQPGEVGATKEEYGVFLITDRGLQWYGAQKPYFKELFLKGKHFTGRWVYRLIERRKPAAARAAFLWQFGKPLDQTPYVLSKRAVKEGWIPPYNVSCMPPEIKAKIPAELQFWKKKSQSDRKTVRDSLVQVIKKGQLKITYEGVKLEQFEEAVPYVIQYHYWKKRTLIRVGPSAQHWDLRIAENFPKGPVTHWVLYSNPLTSEIPVPGYLKPCPDVESLKKEGYIKPGTPEWNPTKDTPAWVIILTKGKAVVVQKSDIFYKIKFLSGTMKGLWIAKREAPKAMTWTLSRSALPEPE